MFDRFAAKGPALILGLAAALLTASTARAGSEKKPDPKDNPNVVVLKSKKDAATAPFKARRVEGAKMPSLLERLNVKGLKGSGAARTAPTSRFRAVAPTAPAGSSGAAGLPISVPVLGHGKSGSGGGTASLLPGPTPPAPPSAGQGHNPRPRAVKPAKSPSMALVNVPKINKKGGATNGGTGAAAPGGDADDPLTNASGYSVIEPKYLPRDPKFNPPDSAGVFTSFVFASNPGGDFYPPPAPDPTKDTSADPPFADQLPAFLVGLNDFHIYYSITGSPVTFGDDPDNQGEQFEPSVGADGALVFSAFWGPHKDVYKPSAEFTVDGEKHQFDYHGFPVRTISLSQDAIAQNLDGKDATITKILPPGIIGVLPITTTDENGENPQTKYMPVLAPDASPVAYPLNPRFILFVSLRGYDPADPDTHYTRLFMWDTAKDFDKPGSVRLVASASIGGKPASILNPEFSPDGRLLAYTISSQSFDAFDADLNYAPDPIFDTDVTGAALTQAFISRVMVSTINIPDPGDGIASARLGASLPGGSFMDADGNAPREMMPFFSELGQLGFSSDRVDTDGDGLGDTVETDPAKATFSLYMFQAPYNTAAPDMEDAPDASARRLTFGAADTDIFNELHGSAAKYDQLYVPNNNSVPDVLDLPADLAVTPVVIYQVNAAEQDPADEPVVGDWNLWRTDFTSAARYTYDGNALVGLPQVTGNAGLTDAQKLNLSQTHRVGLPGDFVNFSVQLNPKYFPLNLDTKKPDYTLGKVYAIVKDPDNYMFRPYYDDHVASSVWTTVYREANAFPVRYSADDVQYFNDVFGSADTKPTMGSIVQLTPDPVRVGWYNGRWFAPLEASDFMMDVKVETFTGDVYTDNIGGFSTAPFVPSSQALLVSDFTAGQRSVPATTGVPGTEGVPTESYFTVRPHSGGASGSKAGAQSPLISVPLGDDLWAVLGPRVEYQNVPSLVVNPDTGRVEPGPDSVVNEDNPLSAIPYALSPGANLYDLWRTQCREPITLDDQKADDGTVIRYGVLRNYLPYTHTAPGYPDPDQTRIQTVADRAVFWAAPHAGDLNGNAGQNSADVGTIANLTTQQEIMRYLLAGGRFALSGNDVAFTLSQNNPASKNALLQQMRVQFETDADRDTITVYNFNRLGVSSVDDSALGGLNPIPYSTWTPHWAHVNQPPPSNLDLAAPFDWDVRFSPGRQDNRRNDGAPTNFRIDSITGINTGQPGGAYPFYKYDTGNYGGISSYAPYPDTNTSTRKTAFFAFGLEGVDRQYVGSVTDNDMGTVPHFHAHNPLALIMHNTLDWLTTTTMSGQVFITNNVSNPNGVLVYAVDDFNQDAHGRVMATTLTDDQGNYTLDGLDSSIYLLYAYKTGFTMQHDVREQADSVLAGQPVNLTLIPAQPGKLSGLVRDAATQTPLVGVPVTAVDIQNSVNITVTTDANGRYTFPVLPAGLYVISTPVLDNQAPTNQDYGAFTNDGNPLSVLSGANADFNINLGPKPAALANLTGVVRDAATQKGLPDVTLTFSSTAGVTLATVKSAQDGSFSVTGLPAGPVVVTTPALNNHPPDNKSYAPFTNAGNPLVLNEGDNGPVNIDLQAPNAPKPATITVKVMDASKDPAQPGAGAVVTLTNLATGQLAATMDGKANPVTTGDDGIATFKVEAGRYSVNVQFGPFTDIMQIVTAQPDAQTGGTTVNVVFGAKASTDRDLTPVGTANDIEPNYVPLTNSVLYSSNRLGPDAYPNEDDGDILPFLKGVPDYHIYQVGRGGDFSGVIRFGLSNDERGEQFEPDVTLDNNLVFSAFLPASAGAYRPQDFQAGGTPVRTIVLSNNAFGDQPSFSKIVPPGVFNSVPVTDPGTGTVTQTPQLAPDASPVWLPVVPDRYVFFVSLRGYKAGDKTTHYTTLWMWDTAADFSEPGLFGSGNPRRVLAVPNKSILWPKFNRDGTKVAFTLTDYSFEPDDFGMPPDIVWDFDVTKAALAKPFTARTYVSDVVSAGGNYQVAEPVQASFFADDAGNAPRDIMPFWTALNQLGFSSDRVDTDGDGYADAVQTDPTKATFSLYLYPFSYSPQTATEQSPDTTAVRQTQGAAAEDVSNELRGAAPAIVTAQSGANQLKPTLAYQSDVTGNWDIWETNPAAPVTFDGNILTGLPVVTGNTDLTAAQKQNLADTFRVGLPGDYVNITVQLNTAHARYSDVQAVNVYLKDPDRHSFQELYGHEVDSGIIPEPVYVESDSGMPVEYTDADAENYTTKFGGKPDAPQKSGILMLKPVPGRAGLYTGKWYTPLQASDFLMDVTLVYSQGTATVDNVAGLSTAPFVPTSQTLIVSDFAAGQRSVGTTTKTLTTGGVPTESYFTWRPHATMGHPPAGEWKGIVSEPAGALDPDWAVMGPRVEWQSFDQVTADPATGRTAITNPDGSLRGVLNGDPRGNPLVVASAFVNPYDLWRVQCRAPIGKAVLDQYRPYLRTQPGYPDPQKPRTQIIADRTVLWLAPHAGQLNGNAGQNSTPGNGGVDNLGFGTIANTTTQNNLIAYLSPDAASGKPAGRLLISGDDVAFVLTQNGAQSNALLTAMGVAFVDHFGPGEIDPANGGRPRQIINASLDGRQAGTNPIPYGVWQHYITIASQDFEPDPITLHLAPFIATDINGVTYHPFRAHDSWEDGAFTNLYIDSVVALAAQDGQTGPSQLVYNYSLSWDGTDPKGKNTDVAGVQTQIPPGGNNTAGRKTLYFPFGLEGIHRGYYNNSVDNLFHSPNRPMQVFHNAVDWMTTGAFRGQVFINNNVANTDKVLVWAVDDYNANEAGKIKGTAITNPSGQFYMDGMDVSQYRLYAYKTGFAAQNPTRAAIDSGNLAITGGGIAHPGVPGTPNSTEVNLFLVQVQPGTLRGVVTDKDTGEPLAGVTVKIHDIQNIVNQTTVTDANGQYQFTNIAAGLYVVEVPDGMKVGDKTYAAYTNSSNPIQVATDNYPGDPKGDTVLDFSLTERVLPPSPATVTVKVYDADAGANAPAAGAVVTLTDTATGQVATTLDGNPNPATTDDTGTAVFHVVAGTYSVKVEYKNSRRTFTPQTRPITALPDDTKPGGITVEFTFGGILHTFGANKVLMASAPYEYNASRGMTFDAVLGISDRNALANAIVAYDALNQKFLHFPTYPADTFHLGRGYGFKLPTDGQIYDQGTEATTDQKGYSVIRAEIGWNLIATPFTGAANWNSTGSDGVKFALRDDPAQKLHAVNDLTDAVTVSNILSPLWGPTRTDEDGNGVFESAYTPAVGTMLPWQSYWVKVAQPTLFYVPRPAPVTPAARSLASRFSAARMAAEPEILMPRADVWGVNITASSGDVRDAGLALGIASKATSGFDAGLDMEKPSPMSASGPSIQTGFRGEDGGVNAADIRGTGANTWSFQVKTNLKAKPVTLSWTANHRLPAGAKATLVDTVTGQRVDMGAGATYTFTSGANGGERVFRVEVR